MAEWNSVALSRTGTGRTRNQHKGQSVMSKSIATKTGDRGQTGLVGGVRVSKASLRVETYGTVDELNSFLGFARSICEHAEIKELTHSIQKELFVVGGELATPTPNATPPSAKSA